MASSSLESAGYLAALMGISIEQGRCFSTPTFVLSSNASLNIKLDQVDHHCSELLSSPSKRFITHGLKSGRGSSGDGKKRLRPTRTQREKGEGERVICSREEKRQTEDWENNGEVLPAAPILST